MLLYPDNAAIRIGFDIVIGQIEEQLRTPQGRERWIEEKPTGDQEVVSRLLREVSQVQDLLQFDDPLSWNELPDIRTFLKSNRPRDSVPDPLELLDLLAVVNAAETLAKYLRPRISKYASLQRICDRCADLSAIRAVIENSVGQDGGLLDSASAELSRIRRAIVSREGDLRNALQRELRRAISNGYATEEQPTIRNGRMVIPIRAEAKRKVTGFVQDTSATGQTVFIEPESCLNLNNDLRELQARERQEERRVLASIGDLVRSQVDEISASDDALADFDCIRAKARIANIMDGIVPRLNTGGPLAIHDGRNPALALHFVRLAEESRQVVPLSLEMNADQRSLLITGPNAGGKTVALGTVGLFSIMLGHGIPIPAAEGTEMPVFSKIFVDIGDEQSIENDLSTFSSHMRNVREMVAEADETTLALIDEAGTGTDPEEGAALAQATLEALNAAGSWTVATTHHGRLKAFAHEAVFVRNAAMEFDLETLAPTYRLRMDVPGSSYAFEIGRRMNLPTSLLDRARELVGAPKTSLESLIIDYESRLALIATRQEESRRAMQQALELKAEYDARRAEFDRDRERLRKEALIDAERIVAQANARIEKTIREIRESQAAKEATKSARQELDGHRSRLAKEIAASNPVDLDRSASTAGQVAVSLIVEGDQVLLDDGSVTADVIRVDGDEAEIVSGNLRMRVSLSRLRKVGGRRNQQVQVRRVEGESNVLSSLGVRQRIDIRGHRVAEAVSEVDAFIDAALPTSIKQLEILHGTGTGALRTAIRNHLDGRSDVGSYDDAEWEAGGPGVTVVHLA